MLLINKPCNAFFWIAVVTQQKYLSVQSNLIYSTVYILATVSGFVCVSEAVVVQNGQIAYKAFRQNKQTDSV